jgi:predicted transcriptional regulator
MYCQLSVCYLKPFLPSLDGRDVASNAAANDDQVSLLYFMSVLHLVGGLGGTASGYGPDAAAYARLHLESAGEATTVGSLPGNAESANGKRAI